MTSEWQPPRVPVDEQDQRIQAALQELRGLIAARYPEVCFTVSRGEDPDGIYLKPAVDIDDLDAVDEAYADRLLEMQIEEGLPVYVIPIWPLERVRKHLQKPAARSILARIPVGWP